MKDPSSINKKRSECTAPKLNASGSASDHEKRRTANRMRGYKLAQAARKSKELEQELTTYLTSTACDNLPNEQSIPMINLRASLSRCANHALYRKYSSNGALEFIAAKTCKHKLCPVCNKERARALRTKYWKFFDGGDFLLPKYEKVPVYDKQGNAKKDRKTLEIKKKRQVVGHEAHKTKDFNFMHLTLTVPHSNEGGFRGERFYATELMKEFNFMRKKAFWKNQVFGGEFGCEVTRGENGLHVHIHAFLIVHNEFQSRNKLQRCILEAWNRQTASEDSSRKAFTEKDLNGICRSLGYKAGYNNTDWTKHTNDKFLIDNLDSTGATVIGLENLYTTSRKKKAPNDVWLKNKQRWKHYVDSSNPEEFLSGIMECIKYHFEPVGLQKHQGKKYERIKTVEEKKDEDGQYKYVAGLKMEVHDYEGIYDFDLLREILPKIYGKPLYRKFGCLHGVDCLNINSSVEDEMNEEAKDHAREDTINPETLKPEKKCQYIVCRQTAVYYDEKKDLKPVIRGKHKIRYLQSDNMLKAINEMIQLGVKDEIDKRQEYQKKVNKKPKEFDAFAGIEPNYKF